MAHKFGITIKTRLSFEELENVIGQYSQSEYTISLGGLDESSGSPRKIMLVWFDKAEDRDRLKRFFAERNGKGPGMPGYPAAKPRMAAA